MKVIDIVDNKEVPIPSGLTLDQILTLLADNNIDIRYISSTEVLVSQGHKVLP
jgi:hypothetical protein